MRKTIFAITLLCSTNVMAEELTLNSIPEILFNLRGCKTSILSTSCKIPESDIWIAVRGDGTLTLFKQQKYGDTIYANGKTVKELIADFARVLNESRARESEMLEALGPYLQTQ